jgi:hypothetical protein
LNEKLIQPIAARMAALRAAFFPAGHLSCFFDVSATETASGNIKHFRSFR